VRPPATTSYSRLCAPQPAMLAMKTRGPRSSSARLSPPPSLCSGLGSEDGDLVHPRSLLEAHGTPRVHPAQAAAGGLLGIDCWQHWHVPVLPADQGVGWGCVAYNAGTLLSVRSAPAGDGGPIPLWR